uniref:Uncharacterized protein n=1 Tax=Rhizophora mucronata TaxID=61149 RepID=A0A2P2KU11_RHIMU
MICEFFPFLSDDLIFVGHMEKSCGSLTTENIIQGNLCMLLIISSRRLHLWCGPWL